MWDGDLTGEVVDGRYALGSLYGTGGMAEVYRAFDTRLDRKVALKFFQGEASGEDRIRLDREAQVLGEMRCPGLVEVYGTGVFRGRPYFVMQAVEGGTLRRRMRGALEPEVVATIGAQVAGVLAHVHEHGVVHRDVKPSNILLDAAGRRAYLADFGLALQAQVTRVTRSGILVGTAGYLAPEQVRGADVQPSADVYALGLVLLECLTGRPEYPGGDTEAALSRLHREPRIPANLPDAWTRVLTAMTASDPAKRPTAAECERLLTAAGKASAGLPPLVEVAEVVVASTPPVAEAEPRRKDRRVLLGGVMAAAAFTAVTLVVLTDTTAPEHGRLPGQPGTTSAGDPVAEQAPGTVLPDGPAGSTVTFVNGTQVHLPAGNADNADNPAAGHPGDSGEPVGHPAEVTTTDGARPTTTKSRPETPGNTATPTKAPSNGPVVVPTPPVETGPPSRDRGATARG
ncbi:serine/threonine-protein kinase [Saccharothrix hoggarensis]|uniref:non-specific serine/threonine protein kinase n=1 Tax=Saccharothrix hoggarensis TaxID=913853 RepID=A0ABW3R326_9PSEU